jgi:hypothetical protein
VWQCRAAEGKGWQNVLKIDILRKKANFLPPTNFKLLRQTKVNSEYYYHF